MQLANRGSYEIDFARRVARLSAEQKRELATLLGDPPDYANVPQAFWDKCEDDDRELLLLLLIFIFAASAKVHGMDAETAAVAAQSWAEMRSGQLAAGMSQTTQERVRSIQPNSPRQEVLDALDSIYGPARSESIAVTETTAAISAGGEAAIATLAGTSTADLWITERDASVCPICRPLNGVGRDEWQAFFPLGPPAHPRCRCWIKYEGEQA